MTQRMSKEERKKALRSRTNESVGAGDNFVKGKKGSVLDLTKFADDVDDIKFYEPKHGKGNENHIDILPFEITMPWYENLRTFNKSSCGVLVGHLDYKLEVPIHYDVGVSGQTILCIREAFGHKCAVCDEMFELYAEENGKVKYEKQIKKLRPKWRCFYNVYDYDAPDDDYRLWECSYHNFESKLKADAQLNDGGSVEFADPESGKTIVFRGNQKVLGKNEYVEAGDINFDDREPYDEDELLAEVYPLDSALKIPTEEDVKNMHLEAAVDDNEAGDAKQGSESQQEDTTTSSRRRSRKSGSAEKTDDTGGDSENPCPAGGRFGHDMNELDACQKCADDIFTECETENSKLGEDSGQKAEAVEDQLPEHTPPRNRQRSSGRGSTEAKAEATTTAKKRTRGRR